jgi:uncharacterized 2Fe-2S/4Fe-4S cluster protein (DUF4445 family)
MNDIKLTFYKKHSGYPHSSAGFNAITFLKDDLDLVAKIINEVDMSDENNFYNLSTKELPIKEVYKILKNKISKKKLSLIHNTIDITI